jgi:hypothetical protein
MNDNAITDDLLEELEQLESSAEALEHQMADTHGKQEQFSKLGSADQIDAATLALQTAQTAQDAALQSQRAAETSLKHAHRQKEQIMELTDANFAWRQAVKAATSEIHASKSTFAILLSAGVIVSLVAMSVMGWLLYSMQKKEAQFKGEVLDILQTEIGLLNKNMTVKVDQISSLLELLAAEIQKLNGQAPSHSQNVVTMDRNTPPTSERPSAPSALPASDPVSQEQVPSAQLQNHPDASAQMSELKPLIEQIFASQQQLQASVLSEGAVSQDRLTSEQQKQLAEIDQLIRKQSKTLADIQKRLDSRPQQGKGRDVIQNHYLQIQNSLTTVNAQLTALQNQQNTLKTQVESLLKATQKLAEEPKPYSYRIPK